MNSMFKKPSAWIPVVMSLAILVMVLITIKVSGVDHEVDEGAAAHIFQIWLVLEVLTVAFFAVKWLPQRPKDALFVIAVQIVIALVACAPVFYFKL
jgi:hypothetical protein